MNDAVMREMINNQKRIIRELKRIADALEEYNRNSRPKKNVKPFGVDIGMAVNELTGELVDGDFDGDN